MRAWGLLLFAMLALGVPASANAGADDAWLLIEFGGAHVSNGLCDESACRAPIETFELPDGAAGVYLRLLNTHREPVEIRSNFDIYLDAPDGMSASLFHSGLSLGTVYGCWPGDLVCDFEGRSTWTMAAAEGAWVVSYRGVHYGDLLLGVFVV